MDNKNHHGVLMLLLLIMKMGSLLQDNANLLLLRLGSLRELFVFENSN